MVTFAAPLCVFCVHLTKTEHGPMKCDAFPFEIPEEIMHSLVDHRNPVKGDRGITFSANSGEGRDYPKLLFGEK